ncbi:MAG: esterase-like activity of phytase family protein, partial [Candidatus Binatia bacterium]
KNTPDEMKLSGVIAINPTTLLVLERTDLVAKLYSVDLSRATNILNSKWDDAPTAPSLEALSDPSDAAVRVLPKSLVVDLSSLDGVPEKIEGIALLDARALSRSRTTMISTAKKANTTAMAIILAKARKARSS